jgi:OmpA-OmpF porin, OOP family
MKRYFSMVFFVMAMVTLVAGCAVQRVPMGPPESISPVDLTARVQAGQLVKKVDNFLVIFDASSSMGELYKGERKLDRALRIATGLNQTLPEVPLMGGLRMFGRRAFLSFESTTLLYGMTSYKTSEFEKGLQSIQFGRGYSPMAMAIDAAALDLAPTRGNIALIIISDGKDMGNGPYVAAKHLAAGLGNRICIYTIQVGDDQGGKELLERIAKASGCGSAVNGDQILSSEGMAGFVESAFFEKHEVRLDSDGDGVYDDMDKCPNTPKGVQVDANGCPSDADGDGVPDYLDKCPNTAKGVKVDSQGCPLDSDGDGVPDYLDKCPNTPKGATVNDRGCWVLKGLTFDTAKWNVKPNDYPILDDVVRVLRENPSMKLEVGGHTDNRGAAGYNLSLSKKRAAAVMEYLLKKGISKDRLTSNGYGFSRPAAPNDTPEGRAENRRVELKPLF